MLNRYRSGRLTSPRWPPAAGSLINQTRQGTWRQRCRRATPVCDRRHPVEGPDRSVPAPGGGSCGRARRRALLRRACRLGQRDDQGAPRHLHRRWHRVHQRADLLGAFSSEVGPSPGELLRHRLLHSGGSSQRRGRRRRRRTRHPPRRPGLWAPDRVGHSRRRLGIINFATVGAVIATPPCCAARRALVADFPAGPLTWPVSSTRARRPTPGRWGPWAPRSRPTYCRVPGTTAGSISSYDLVLMHSPREAVERVTGARAPPVIRCRL